MSWAEENYDPIPDEEHVEGTADHRSTTDRSCLGWDALYGLSFDGILLLQCKALRMYSYGILGVMLTLYLAELKYTNFEIGTIFTLTLFGDSMISLVLTTHADRYGRRKSLLVGSVIAVITSVVFITRSNYIILTLAATLGVISPSGTEVGPFNAIELSALSQISNSSTLTKLMAWYNLFGCFACALGSLSCGFFLEILQNVSFFNQGKLEAYRTVLIIYTFIQMLLGFLFFLLSKDVEIPNEYTVLGTSSSSTSANWIGLHKSKSVVVKISVLFALDAFAGSFIMQTLISNWFYLYYQTPPSVLGALLFFCNLLAGISALFSARIAASIGLVWTMVLTHLPSNVLTILVPLMPDEFLAIFLLCLRFSISQMDVPTRNAYVQGVVEPDERSAANGATYIARLMGAASGPVFSGYLMSSRMTLNDPWFIAGGLKIVYDLLLLWNFRTVESTSDVTIRR